MSYLADLREARNLIALANRMGWTDISVKEIDKILNDRRHKVFGEVGSMFRKDLLATAITLGIVDRALHPKTRATFEFYGMLVSLILAYADKIPLLKSISSLAGFAATHRLTLQTAALTLFILWFLDLLFGEGSYGFDLLSAIGQKYGFALSSEGIVGVFKQLASDIKSAVKGKEKKEESYATVSVPTPTEEEKVKEEEYPIIKVPESL